MAWRWAAASEVGTSHIRRGDRLQDAYAVSTMRGDCVFAIVSDGAGSAEFGVNGAWLVCRMLKVRVRDWLRDNSRLPGEKFLSGWIEEIRKKIEEVAERRKSTPRQFATTLAAIVSTPDETLTLQIGDSAIVGRCDEEWEVLCWPDNGEFVGETYFVTDDPEPRLHIRRDEPRYNAFALFTDGINDQVLLHENQSAYPQFFNPMLRPVDSAMGTGRLVELSAALGTYLSGPRICERTDDDKTLILISGA